MSIPSWVDILHLQARQKEEEGQAPDFTFTAALTSLLQEQKARASFSPDVCETSPVVSLTLFSIQPRISSATNTHGATSAASSKAYSPQSKHLWRFFSWTPPQSLGQLQICWERPIGNKPEAWATTQPDSPGWKPEIPGEIHALDFFFLLVPLSGHYKPQTTQGQCGCTSAEPPHDILLLGEPALKLLLPYRCTGLVMGVSSWWLGSMGCRSTWFSL